jgi:hypothetical protein
LPDLMTHLAASYLTKRAVSPKHHMVPFLLGATLPDTLSYIPSMTIRFGPPLLILFGVPVSQAVPAWLERIPALKDLEQVFRHKVLRMLLARGRISTGLYTLLKNSRYAEVYNLVTYR